ncbi:DYW family of nucleic acid deaminases-domain-containing protein [Coniochaeta sp. 2T2.1]|nr:DYW family of nucleic acid deaminases-domain-containing protein [Coniochaeta sp. 2T2.1]
MADKIQPTPKPIQAKVEWWDCSSVYVRCPSCERIHSHTFSGYDTTLHQRVSHCDMPDVGRCEYEMQFPFLRVSEDIGYDIDKQRALFVSSGADPTDYFLEHESTLPSGPLDSTIRRKWTEAIEMVHIREVECGIPGGYSYRKIEGVVSDMVQGNVQCVRHYLGSSTEADIFLHGVEAYDLTSDTGTPWDNDANNEEADDFDSPNEDYVQHSGKTALHLAACEAFPEMLELLLQNGADPDARDATGRVALAEAALWGRLENVKVLLKFGAKKQLECVRNGRPTRPIDFAKAPRVNAEERYVRAGAKHQLYKENTYQRDQDRRAIVRFLEDETTAPGRNSLSPSGFAFTKSLKDENLLTLVAHFDIPKTWKTIGVLYRGDQLPCVAAMSGWVHQENREVNIQIAGRDWTAEVRRLCDFIGYNLPEDPYDQGEPGRFKACHAEKQLIAFFVNRHLFLSYETETEANDDRLDPSGNPNREFERLKVLINNSDQVRKQLYQKDERLKKEAAHKVKLSALENAIPAAGLRKAMVLVCRPICWDCQCFLERVNTALCIDIRLVHRCLEPDCKVCRG